MVTAEIISALMGIFGAVLLHWFTWWLRLHRTAWTTLLGICGALGITAYGMMFLGPYTGEIAGRVLTALISLWILAFVIGLLQARSIPAPWWVGTLGLFFEAALGFLILSAVNLSLQRYAIQLGFDNRFQETSTYPVISHFMWTFVLTFLVLALIRPFIRMHRLPGREDRY